MRWIRKVTPWVAAISLIGNIYFVQRLWKSETHANRYLWGNVTMYVIAGVTWAETGSDPGAHAALASLDLMRSLPRYDQRVGPEQLQTIERFLRKASEVQAKVAEEHERLGAHTEETARELDKVRAGFALLQGNLHRVNDLQKERYALNDNAWRSMWTDIDTGLRRLDLN